MGFAGWGRRCELVIQSSQVDQDCTDFPVLVHEDSLPSEIFDADGSYPALNGGGDLRFSTDQAGDSQIPCEIESFVTDNDPANGKSAVWAKRTLSSASNTSIWVYYNKAGESQPAETDAYGKHAVWDSNFVMVQHMAETPPGTIVDSTSNSNDGTTSGMDSADQVAGQIDGSLDFDGNDYVDVGDSSELNLVNAITVSAWIEPSIFNYLGILAKKSYAEWNSNVGYSFSIRSTGGLHFKVGNKEIYTNTNYLDDSKKHYVVGRYIDNTLIEMYSDSILTDYTGKTQPTGISASSDNLYIGKYYTDREFSGIIDEVRISNTARSAGWIATEYNNQNAPSTFLIEGTPESPGVGVTIPVFMSNYLRQMGA